MMHQHEGIPGFNSYTVEAFTSTVKELIKQNQGIIHHHSDSGMIYNKTQLRIDHH